MTGPSGPLRRLTGVSWYSCCHVILAGSSSLTVMTTRPDVGEVMS